MYTKRAIICFLIASFTTSAIAQSYCIKGKISGFANNAKIVLTDDDAEANIDSTVMKNNYFAIKGYGTDMPKYLSLNINEAGAVYTCIVFAGEGTVLIKGDKKDFPYNLKIYGPAEQVHYNAYLNKIKALKVKKDVFVKIYSTSKDPKIRNDAVSNNNIIAEQINDFTIKYIPNHLMSYYAVKLIYDYVQDMKKDSIEAMYTSLDPEIKKSIYGKRIYTWLKFSDTIKINDQFFDFQANDQYGKVQKLSNIKDKYILIDFSSVYCGPCAESIEELRLLSKKYASLLDVITFSLDNKQVWLKGVADSSLSWLSLNDGEKYFSKAVIKYGIIGIPTFFLISPEGKVIYKSVGYEMPKSGAGTLETAINLYIKQNK